MVLALTIVAVMTLPLVNVASAQGSHACYPSIKHAIEFRLPELSSYVNLSHYAVRNSNLNYTSAELLVFRFNSQGISITAHTLNSCELVFLEIVVDARYTGNASTLNNLLNSLEKGVKNWYDDLKATAESVEYLKVIGGQLVINNTPVYFVDRDAVTITPVLVRYYVYPSPPITIFSLINQYPVVKDMIANIPNFSVNVEDALTLLKNRVNLTEYRGVAKAYVVLAGSVRPAYVVAVSPYRNLVVLADSCEVLSQRTLTSWEEAQPSNEVTSSLSILLIVVAVVTGVYIISKLRRSLVP